MGTKPYYLSSLNSDHVPTRHKVSMSCDARRGSEDYSWPPGGDSGGTSGIRGARSHGQLRSPSITGSYISEGSVRLESREFSPKSARDKFSTHATLMNISTNREERRHQIQKSVDTMSPSAPYDQPPSSRSNSELSSNETNPSSLSALQTKGHDDNDHLSPLEEEDLDPGSFDLVSPPDPNLKLYSLEIRSDQLFSTEHLKVIFKDPSLLYRFTSFLSTSRPNSIPLLVFYLDALKAIKAINYANAIAEALDSIPGFEFTAQTAPPTQNLTLETKASQAFDILVREDLPAYITHIYVQIVSISIMRRITGTLPMHLRDASEGLAEVFCLTDVARPDNPIVFASEEFHRTTQYGMNYVIGRNCRFLQGPRTNQHSVRRLHEKIAAGIEHVEVFLNYRRDGSPFMNLLFTAPLRDSKGVLRYFIGAQVDVSGLVKDCSDLESLDRLVVEAEQMETRAAESVPEPMSKKDEFQDLSEMFNIQELDTVRRSGGRMHKDVQQEVQGSDKPSSNWNKPRLLIQGHSPKQIESHEPVSGKLGGVYEHYLLVRPYPSLKILFASPSLRVPGILQSPFMNKIGGSSHMRDELTQALADGRGVTAKVRWISKQDLEGRTRWIHCTPLIGNNGSVGVWMVVICDEESDSFVRKIRRAPPVPLNSELTRATPIGDDSLRIDRYGTQDVAVGQATTSGMSLSGRINLANGSVRSYRPSTSSLASQALQGSEGTSKYAI